MIMGAEECAGAQKHTEKLELFKPEAPKDGLMR